MDSTPILSFNAPQGANARLEILASPAFELAYAFFFLAQHPEGEGRRGELPWLDAVYRDLPELPLAVSTFWLEEPKRAGLDLFWLIGEFGYARDPDPTRFLNDLPDLVARMDAKLAEHPPCDDPEAQGALALLRERLESLHDDDRLARYRDLLRTLWEQLEGRWATEGRLAVEAARAGLERRFDETGDVMAALPAHHFAQFEAASDELRAAQEAGKLRLVPLSVASGGGFNIEVQGTRYLGFGLLSESLFERLKSQADEGAAQFKVLADPTRLLLLTLIARYDRLAITVGDLAKQLGVSQPTVSGHLKQLRSAGLVRPEREGTKTFYRLEREAVGRSAQALRELLKLS